MSGAFDAAWAVLKMARYTAGPYEIWDSAERYRGQEGEEQFGHLPQTYTVPNYEQNEEGEWVEEGTTEKPQFYPIGVNSGFEFKAGKAMMTPEQFHGLVAAPAPEHRWGQQTDIREAMDQGAPIAAPFLKLVPEEDGRFRVVGHEGRHRMQALRDAGYGDVPVPIELQGSKYGLGHDMTNEKFREALMNAIIRPEYGYYGADELARAKSHHDIGEEYRMGLHALNKPFLVSNIDPVWTRGEYR
jgi:hypothetical protein